MFEGIARTGEANAAAQLSRLLPGLLLAVLVATASYGIAAFLSGRVPLTPMVAALIVGIALHPFGARPAYRPGTDFCVKHVLRWGVALLGIRKIGRAHV